MTTRATTTAQGRFWRMDVLAAIAVLHGAALCLLISASPKLVPEPQALTPARPLHMVMIEPINAPLVAPSGNAVQPSNQAASQSIPQTPAAQSIPRMAVPTPAPAKQKPTPTVSPPAKAVTTPSPAVNHAISTPIAATTDGGEHSITASTATSSDDQAGETQSKTGTGSTGASATTASAAPSSSAPGKSSSPPRFGVAYLSNPAPKYPTSARRMGEEGKVLLRVLVSLDGLAKQVLLRASSGSSALDNSAMAAVRKWRFIPAKLNGDTVEAWVQVPIVFKLDN